ncbi:glycosyltransferase [Mucilaginibacter litoreus]|uniref:Glycosyltransferase n=1 Tax=Mucilaginibacter litoreus TaxID=1048221 RepID=A0ABW3AM00_9SPHI
MRIIHVIGAFDKKLGGTYSAILSIIRMENALGYQSEVLSLVSNGQEYDEELKGRVHLFPPSFPYVFSNSIKASEWLSDNIGNYNLIVIHEVWGATAIKAAHLAYKMGVPYVIWPHGSLDPFDLQKKKALKKIVGNVLISNITRNAKAICCTSELEGRLLQTYNRLNDNIHLLPLPINYTCKGSRAAFRHKFNISDKDFVLLFVARIDYKKGLDILLKALHQFIDKAGAVNCKLLIAGKGNTKYETYIRSLIEDLALEKHVTISGFLAGDDKANAYAGADCFVLPSMNENYGISVIEALQSDLPVLISDNVYIWKDIMPQAGWVCKHDVDSVHAYIKNVYKAFQTGEISLKTPGKAGSSFNQQNLMPEYANFYGKILYQQVQTVLHSQLTV